jgi:hypothetical protein
MLPIDAGFVVHRYEARLALVLAERARPDLLLEAQPHARGGSSLATHVDRGGLVFADAHRDEASDRVRGLGLPHTLGYLVENAVAHRAAVEQPVILHVPPRLDALRLNHRCSL